MKRNRLAVLTVAIILTASALLGGLYGPTSRATAAAPGDLEQSVETFTRVLAIVEHNYARTVNVDEAIYEGAIPGMLRVLDPHSTFFDREAFARLRENQMGRYFGVGMQIMQQGRRTIVIAPFVGSPAYRAGIRPGDVILKVDGKPCEGLSGDEVAALLKGPKGTVVHITVGREGWAEPIEFTVVRDEIPRPGVDFYTLVRPGIGYIRISDFNETTGEELAQALDRLDARHLDGLILDLRDNLGGLLNQAVEVADSFLDKDQLIVSHRGRSSPERRYYAVHGNRGIRVPLVVLINGATASASEIVAGALQDHDRALIVGQTSFGKGLVQTVSELSDGTGLALTTARYYTPSGRLIQRPYQNISYWEYRWNPQPPKKPDVKLTDSGRRVYGEGGITPDVPLPEPKRTKFQEMLLRRGVFFPAWIGVGSFTRYYLGQRPTITRQFVPDDSVIRQFTAFLDREHVPYTPQDIQENLNWIRWKIQREVISSVFGIDDGYKIELEHDPEVQKAIELMPQARALYENARKVLAERTGHPVVNP